MLCCDQTSSVCSPLSPGLEPPGEPGVGVGVGVGGAEGDGSSVGPGRSVVLSDLGKQTLIDSISQPLEQSVFTSI